MTAAKPVRVAIYSRVSTDEQVANGISLSQQPELVERELIKRFGAAGYDVVLRVEDAGLSGSYGPSPEDFKRPTKSKKYRQGLRELFEAIEAGELDYVAAYDSSRFYRSSASALSFYAFLQKHSTKVLTVSEQIDLSSPAGELNAGVMAVVAQFQRKQSNERIKHHLNLRREKGLWQGTAPFGWRYPSEAEVEAGQAKTLVAVPDQLKIVRRIADLYTSGISEKAIADQLNAEGVKHVLKKKDPLSQAQLVCPWDWQSIGNILKCCAHAGLIRQPEGRYIEGKHFPERAYDPEVFFQIRDSMADRRTKLRGVPKSREDNLLSHLVTCRKCGQGLQFVRGQNPSAGAYVCRGYRGRGDYHVYVSADMLLQAILHEMEQLTGIPELMLAGQAEISSLLATEMRETPDRIRELNVAKDKLDRQMEMALEHLREGVLDRDLFRRQRDEIRKRLAPIEEELSSHESRRDSARLFEGRLQSSLKALSRFSDAWLGLTPSEQRELLRLAIEKAEVLDLETHNELHLKLGPFEDKVIPIPKQKFARKKDASGMKGLTFRELAALSYILRKVRPADAASSMGISRPTYSTLCKRAVQRIGESNANAAALKAAPWIARVGHLLPLGPGDGRRGARQPLVAQIAVELYRDGKSVDEIAKGLELPRQEIAGFIGCAELQEGAA